jgi:hypothetical protein
MKRFFYVFITSALLVLLSDWAVAFWQSNSLDSRLESDNFIAALNRQIAPGMSRTEVERVLRGYRNMDVSEEEGSSVVHYGYWFGFIPPIGMLELKYVGEVVVTYSGSDVVLESHFWIN